MAKGKSGASSGKRGVGGRPARTDVDEAMEDARAEVNDVSAALSTPAGAAAADESAGPPEPHTLPDGLLQRRFEKEKTEKEQAIEEKELMQKQLDDMRAKWQSELANNAKDGDVVELSTPCSSKVRSKLL